MNQAGYTGKILIINLTNGSSSVLSSSDYLDYIGGRGFAVKLFYDLVPPGATTFDPENCIIYATGPITGFSGLAGCRWVMCGKSPLRQPEMFSYANLGGRWGSILKYAGYDALVVTGKSDIPIYLYIHDDKIEINDASGIWGQTTFETEDRLKAELGNSVSVLTIGPAAENLVTFATVFADGGASGSGGMGSVMGSKNLKAIAVAGNNKPVAAYPEKLDEISKYVRNIRQSTFNAPSPWAIPGFTTPANCYGCGIGCSRQSYKAKDGKRYKSFCQAGMIYGMESMRFYGEGKNVLSATRLCDAYGLDTVVTQPMISWLIDCFHEGLISEKETGLPFSKAGSSEFIESLINLISFRKGFGNLLAEGTLSAADHLGEKAKALTTRYIGVQTNESKDYDPRLIYTTAIMLATEPRKPVSQLHGISGNTLISWCTWNSDPNEGFLTTDDLRLLAERFWGGTKAVDFSTWEGKALAAKKVQDRAYVQESLILCDVHWPMQITAANAPDGHVGDPSLESRIYSAITGNNISEEELYLAGEKIFNLQRTVNLLHGWNGRDDDTIMDFYFSEPLREQEVFFNPSGLMPGSQGEIISRIGRVIERDEFKSMMDDYYKLRGWNIVTGFPTPEKLRQLDLKELIPVLKNKTPLT